MPWLFRWRRCTRMWADVLRFAAIIEIGLMAGLMLIILYVAAKVLRPPDKTAGFLIWHIIFIVVGLSMVTAVAASSVITRVGDPLSWRSPVFLVGITVINVALVIIFRVELRRMQRKHSG